MRKKGGNRKKPVKENEKEKEKQTKRERESRGGKKSDTPHHEP